jgi:hypothetical protein
VPELVRQLQIELEQLARVRLDVDALLPSLAERPKDQAKLMKTLQKSASKIDVTATKLRGWVVGEFVPEEELAADVLELQQSADSWDLAQFRRGVFPWQQDNSAVEELSDEQLISRLVLHQRQARRCEEELQLLKQEKELALRLYATQRSALDEALAQNRQLQAGVQAEMEDQAEPSNEGQSSGPTAQQQLALLSGKAMLLSARLQRVECIEAAACKAFGVEDAVQAIGFAETCAPDSGEGDAALVLADDGGPESSDDEAGY